jgi:hypothetical protein
MPRAMADAHKHVNKDITMGDRKIRKGFFAFKNQSFMACLAID